MATCRFEILITQSTSTSTDRLIEIAASQTIDDSYLRTILLAPAATETLTVGDLLSGTMTVLHLATSADVDVSFNGAAAFTLTDFLTSSGTDLTSIAITNNGIATATVVVLLA